jgi:hypothetical protein
MPSNYKKTETNQIMAHRSVGFLEARKIVENGHNPGRRILRSFEVLKTCEGTLKLI